MQIKEPNSPAGRIRLPRNALSLLATFLLLSGCSTDIDDAPEVEVMGRQPSLRAPENVEGTIRTREMEPMHAGEIEKGDIFWVAPEFLQPTVEGVAHPHVVIQEDFLNKSRIPTTVLCGISSNLKRAHEPGNVMLDPGEGGLTQVSVVIVSQISVVEKLALGNRVGRLNPERIEQIIRGLRFQQTSYFNR